jgi:hypothetical protein
MTLREHLLAGYHHAAHGGPDPAPATRAEIPAADLQAEMARLAPVLKRDHISRVWTDYMRRVLDLPPPSA